jgi:hypothetical protein
VLDPDRGRVTATRQGRRGRVVLEHTVEHGVWTTRHSESTRKDHYWRSGCIHADRPRARFVEPDWFAISVIVNTGRTSCESQPDSSARATGTGELTGNFTRERASRITCECTSGIACGDEVNFARCSVRTDRVSVASKSEVLVL